ncbi:hypothetical protein ACJX0J_007410, partial [Zea mays]
VSNLGAISQQILSFIIIIIIVILSVINIQTDKTPYLFLNTYRFNYGGVGESKKWIEKIIDEQIIIFYKKYIYYALFNFEKHIIDDMKYWNIFDNFEIKTYDYALHFGFAL